MAASSGEPVLFFSSIRMTDRPIVGGKGASLGELTQAGIPVPPGFVVTTAAFGSFIHGLDPAGAIEREVAGLDPDDLVKLSETTARIRERIEAFPLPADLHDAVTAAYRELDAGSGAAVAVRSSATMEDSAEASFAGTQETFLWVLGEQAVIHYLRACWASLYSAESVVYRRRAGLPEAGLAMGVVVQRMVDALSSGVMFTRSPTTGDRSVIAVEGSWGLGSCVVSGEVTPDKFVVNKVTGEVVQRTVSRKEIEHLADFTAGGVRVTPVPADRREVPCIDPAMLNALVALGRRIETHYGTPQDIEWAVGRETSEIFILQSRPETVWWSREQAVSTGPAAKPFDHVFAHFGGKP